ncbi:T9SS type A sorting domain-containing protein [Dyadobacter sandarakinus]|uniref:T9SS type A sorting domain-containing protein n=1 Tax=Dyadobacter sandarakinus TaxID=2747268 RepID=A0ABX7IDD9_9BACT|nr:T9SS type A sorting domain-containing protein [Dyadobacter sandarakinus]QRR03820.1 T9SS type A sorting domain-containing protein [Dyadobacter sandarakinus]
MRKILFALITGIYAGHAFAQQISPAGIYAASGSGSANGASIDWILGNINMQAAFSAFPVRLISFNAFASEPGRAQLHWKTAVEWNNKGFEIQKSLDVKVFEKIGWVDAASNADNETDYAFADDHFITTSYYRLKQLDDDGHFSYSRIVSLIPDKEKVENLKVFPNPSPDGNIQIVLPEKTREMKIMSAGGSLLKQKSNPETRQLFRLPAAGLYLIRIKTVSEEKTLKVVRE